MRDTYGRKLREEKTLRSKGEEDREVRKKKGVEGRKRVKCEKK